MATSQEWDPSTKHTTQGTHKQVEQQQESPKGSKNTVGKALASNAKARVPKSLGPTDPFTNEGGDYREGRWTLL